MRERNPIAVASNVFEQWQKDFARWLAFQAKNVRVERQLEKLFELTGESWTPSRLKLLRCGGLFREYVRTVRMGGVALAKERIAEASPVFVEHLIYAADRARAKDDLGNLIKATGQGLAHTLPRLDDITQQNLQVNVTFNPKQLALEETPVMETSWEVVKKEKEE